MKTITDFIINEKLYPLNKNEYYPLDDFCDTFIKYFDGLNDEEVEDAIDSFLLGIWNDLGPNSKGFIKGIKKFVEDK